MSVPDNHLAKAREAIELARYALACGYSDEAGRSAYMAAYHAALAFIAARTATSPKTHSGTRSEFGRLARAEPSHPRTGLIARLDIRAEERIRLRSATHSYDGGCRTCD